MPIAPNQALAAVEAPPIQPPTVGLIPSLEGTPYLIDGFEAPADQNDPSPQRYIGGVQYLPEQYEGGVFGALDPCNLQGGAEFMDPPANPGLIASMPFVVWAGDRCRSIGYPAHDFQGRAQRALLATESKQIAHELWTGRQTQLSGWPNPFLASAATQVVTSAAVTPADALSILEEAIAELSNGQQAMIHCTRQMGSALSELGNTFRSIDGTIRTYMDSIICPDAGYPGTGPAGQAAGATQWAYVTLLPTVRRGPIEIIPGSFEEATNRSTNEIDWRAIRYCTADFPDAAVAAAEVSLPMPFGLVAS